MEKGINQVKHERNAKPVNRDEASLLRARVEGLARKTVTDVMSDLTDDQMRQYYYSLRKQGVIPEKAIVNVTREVVNIASDKLELLLL